MYDIPANPDHAGRLNEVLDGTGLHFVDIIKLADDSEHELRAAGVPITERQGCKASYTACTGNVAFHIVISRVAGLRWRLVDVLLFRKPSDPVEARHRVMHTDGTTCSIN